jgi:hypothetical protein
LHSKNKKRAQLREHYRTSILEVKIENEEGKTKSSTRLLNCESGRKQDASMRIKLSIWKEEI